MTIKNHIDELVTWLTLAHLGVLKHSYLKLLTYYTFVLAISVTTLALHLNYPEASWVRAVAVLLLLVLAVAYYFSIKIVYNMYKVYKSNENK